MKRKKAGFTLVELLTVLAIITMRVGLLVPSLAMVRTLAREAEQRAQLNTIGLALTAFRDSYGDYPPSDDPRGYGGAQKLAEALLGWDLLGFHPDSAWRPDGRDAFGDQMYNPATLDERRGPYLEAGTTDAFAVRDLFANPVPLAPGTFVICDAFGARDVILANGQNVRAGTPILYYRANTSSRMLDGGDPAGSIYNIQDNAALVGLGSIRDPGAPHALELVFYSDNGGIVDPKASDFAAVPAFLWPYRPDSYLLISAGADGLYGTSDDITNFGN
jgi:prepilin-type N-terminal cleavage/methylation domain-containing protein